MDTQLITLFYVHYSWSARKIAGFLGHPVSYIEMVIEQECLDLQVQTLPVPAANGSIVSAADLDQAGTGQVERLKNAEVAKQELMQPAYVHAEALILAKVIEAVSDPNIANRSDSHEVLKAHAATLQALKQHAVVNKIVEEKASNSGININVIGMIQ